MANTGTQTSTQKMAQTHKNEQQHSETESIQTQKIKIKLKRFVSYFSGDMAPLGKWMEGKLKQVIPAFTFHISMSIITNSYIKNCK